MGNLLFVYNAKSGKLNSLLDTGHKLFSPKTYQCKLCALTYNAFTENKKWKQFRENSNLQMTFFHTDEFEKKYPNETFEYPVIIQQSNNLLNTFLSKDELNCIASLDELIEKVKGMLFISKE